MGRLRRGPRSVLTRVARRAARLWARDAGLTEVLERQKATAEILRVISRSPADVRPVFEAIAGSAARLCQAFDAMVLRVEGDVLRLVAHRGPLPAGDVPLHRGTLGGRTVLERRVIHVEDLQAEAHEFPEGSRLARQRGHRTVISVPLLREGVALGNIQVRRNEVRPFTDGQVALLQTFADQAVIAIDNARLFTEAQARNRELGEALEQQTATSEILRVISGSPTDLAPVFDTIMTSACRLCEANLAAIWRYDGAVLVGAAHHNASPAVADFIMRTPLKPGPEGATRKAAQERRVVHVADITAEPGFSPVILDVDRARTVLAVPLLRESALIGVITMWRREVRPFSDQQIALVHTFADQAVIAIENVRLFTELQARNRELSEALERETATGEILRVISGSPTDIQPVVDAVAANAARLCGADDAVIWSVAGDGLELVAHVGPVEVGPRSRRVPISRGLLSGHAVLDRKSIHIHDMLEEIPRGNYPDSAEIQRRIGYRTVLVTPLLREGVAIGVILIRRLHVQPFAEKQIELVTTFADQAAIAIENVRLFKELQARNADLSEALERQTATSEVLRVISQSHTDTQPVFGAIIRSAVRLCAGTYGSMVRVDGDRLHLWAHYNYSPEARELVTTRYPAPVSENSLVALAVRTRTLVHSPDTANDPRVRWTPYLDALGVRAQVTVPLLKGGEVIGTLNILRDSSGPFSEAQMELLQTFADQAVIAIENVRLFNELQTRTAQLTRSVEQLRALSDVSQAVSSTLDLETVLSTIVARANQLAGTDACSVFEYDETAGEFSLRATHELDEAIVVATRRTPIRRGEGVQGRMAITRQPVQIPDIAAADAYHGPFRDVLLRAGHRALLAIPLLREDHLVGSLTVNRKAPGEFSPETVSLLETFATQSAIAIQNARLFREIEDKSRQLEAASRHKSQFLASMSHELRTPLNAILGYTELIADNVYGQVPEKMQEVLERVDKSGRHLLGLINDILDLSKIEAGQLTLALGDYSMADVVHSVAASVGALAAEKRLELAVTVDPDLPLGRGDQRRLTQVVLNLVGNALKFTDAGRVSVRAGRADDAFLVAVTDTGPGIAPEEQAKIFEEFQQADSTRTRAKGGTGLGLAIARRIVAMHGGRLWVESAPGQGSTFSFTVPITAS